MNIRFTFLLVSLLFLLSQCQTQEREASTVQVGEETALTTTSLNTPATAFVADLEKHHKVANFRQHEAGAFELQLYFGGKLRFDGTVSSTTDSDKIKMEKEDGTVVYFDGEKVWLSTTDSAYKAKKARFDIFTWQYFFAFPFKMSDPGTNWETMGEKPFGDASFKAGKLTFESGTGDAPDDWYIVYQDNDHQKIRSLGYIVTYGGTPAEKATENAHAIVYSDYKEVEGVPIAHNWSFVNWAESGDIGGGEQIGSATLSNVRFIESANAGFEKPAQAEEIAY